MTDDTAAETTGTLTVAPPPVTNIADAPSKRRKVVGGDAEAALRERTEKARGEEELYFTLRGKEYKLQQPLPAAFLLYAAKIQQGEDVSLDSLVDTITSAFVDEDQGGIYDALLNTKVDVPADIEYLSEMLNELAVAGTNRPTNS